MDCSHKRTLVIDKKNTYTVLGELDVSVNAKVRVCEDCGEEIFDMELDEANTRKAYDKYRQAKGLLTMGEIKYIRRQLDISPETMDRLLNCKKGATRHYEEGGVQTYQYDMLARLLNDTENVRRMVGFPYSALTEAEKNNILEKLEES